MANSDFYVTLPSNTPGHNNTTSKFRVDLPRQIDLVGTWYVALAEISYSYSWPNLGLGKPADNSIVLKYKPLGTAITITVPKRHYTSIQQLVRTIQDETRRIGNSLVSPPMNLQAYVEISDGVTPEIPEEMLRKVRRRKYVEKNPLSKAFEVNWNDSTQRVVVRLKEPKLVGTVFLGPRLQYALGFNTSRMVSTLKGRKNQADHVPDLRAGVYNFYIYSDIVESQIVGNTLSKLLRCVAVKTDDAKFGSTISEVFTHLHYIPVVKKSLMSIEIEICGDNGLPIPFEFGKTVLKLHFSKRVPRL